MTFSNLKKITIILLCAAVNCIAHCWKFFFRDLEGVYRINRLRMMVFEDRKSFESFIGTVELKGCNVFSFNPKQWRRMIGGLQKLQESDIPYLGKDLSVIFTYKGSGQCWKVSPEVMRLATATVAA
ncbi:MAG: hypothetical protein GY793_02190 [Proteobacteria bacterium]|nr:hypothetical protein [Pseudomonadota bacterium]